MKYDPERQHRRSIRLHGYDYRQAGAYFLTLVTYQRECLFGHIEDGQVHLNGLGVIVAAEWARSGRLRCEIRMDALVVMPNHLHGIVIMRDQTLDVEARGRTPLHPYRPPHSLGSFVAGFKSAATKRINVLRGTPGVPVWQRNYYERVIRGEEELNRIRQYVIDNPTRWADDPENPQNVTAGADTRPERPLGITST